MRVRLQGHLSRGSAKLDDWVQRFQAVDALHLDPRHDPLVQDDRDVAVLVREKPQAIPLLQPGEGPAQWACSPLIGPDPVHTTVGDLRCFDLLPVDEGPAVVAQDPGTLQLPCAADAAASMIQLPRWRCLREPEGHTNWTVRVAQVSAQQLPRPHLLKHHLEVRAPIEVRGGMHGREELTDLRYPLHAHCVHLVSGTTDNVQTSLCICWVGPPQLGLCGGGPLVAHCEVADPCRTHVPWIPDIRQLRVGSEVAPLLNADAHNRDFQGPVLRLPTVDLELWEVILLPWRVRAVAGPFKEGPCIGRHRAGVHDARKAEVQDLDDHTCRLRDLPHDAGLDVQMYGTEPVAILQPVQQRIADLGGVVGRQGVGVAQPGFLQALRQQPPPEELRHAIGQLLVLPRKVDDILHLDDFAEEGIHAALAQEGPLRFSAHVQG
mmetsp:Transcript_129074/g.413600  ORF Transcript_129074/g.413600 Transcript_129074/m.413600 type:complete len:434 (+) Transcript_129074:3064-4365(+)